MRSTIIAKGIEASTALREYISEQVEGALIYAYDSIHFITVRISDMNGPKGGVDKRCQIHLKPIGLPTVVVTEVGTSISEVVDRAAQRAAKAVTRMLERANAIPQINVPVLRRLAA